MHAGLQASTALAPPTERIVRMRVMTDAIIGAPVEISAPWGATIAELVAMIPLRPEQEARRAHLGAYLGEHMVPRDRWHRVRPAAYAEHCPVVVQFRLPVHGGGQGGGRKILSIVAAIALFVVTAGIGNGALAGLGAAFEAGKIGAYAAQAVVGVAGGLLIQGLLRPESEDEDKVDIVGVAGARNDFEPGADLPRVLGTLRVRPPIVVPPFTTLDKRNREGDVFRFSQYVTLVVGLAGRHQAGTIYINGVDADTVNGVDYEVRNGTFADPHLTFVDDTRWENPVNINLENWQLAYDADGEDSVVIEGTVAEAQPQPSVVETGIDPDKVRLEWVFPALSYQNPGAVGDAGKPKAAGVALRLRMRPRVDGVWAGWINLPELMIKAREPNNALRLQMEIHWVDSIPAEAGSAWPTDFGAVLKGWAQAYSHAGWPSDLLTPAGAGYAEWRYESQKRIILYLLKSAYPRSRYQIETLRSWPIYWPGYDVETHTLSRPELPPTTNFFAPIDRSGDPVLPDNPSKFQQELTLTSVCSIWNEYPIADDGEHPFLLAARGRDQQFNSVEVVASGVVEDWNGTEWVAGQVTSNPASLFRHVLRDPIFNAEPVPDSLIDEAFLIEWHGFCAELGLKCNALVKGRSVEDTLKMIALCGWVSPTFGAVISGVIDWPRPSGPVGLISQRNAARFRSTKAFADPPHALRVTYLDEETDFKGREVLVYADGFGPEAGEGIAEATRLETVAYEGITNELQARARATLDLAWLRYRSMLHSWTMDFEHLEFRRGDLVLMETDVLGSRSGRARVTAVEFADGLATAIRLDEHVFFGEAVIDVAGIEDIGAVADIRAIGGAAGVAIRLMDGVVVTKRVIDPGADPRRIVFETPFTVGTVDPDLTDVVDVRDLADVATTGLPLIGEGTLVVTGLLSQVARPVLIWAIEPGPDMSATVTAVDYAEEQFGAAILARVHGALDVGDGALLDVGDGSILGIR